MLRNFKIVCCVFFGSLLLPYTLQAMPFDSCGFQLTSNSSTNPILELALEGQGELGSRMRSLHNYIQQSNPHLQSEDIDELVSFILQNEAHTDPIIEPANMWQALSYALSDPNRTPDVLTKSNLSVESQILLWVLEHHLTDFTSIVTAITIGNIHRFIERDIVRLQPNRPKRHYTSTLTRLLSD